jgi:hypothetical protein
MEMFRAKVPQRELDELRQRLEATRWPDQLPGVQWSYGVERDRLKTLVEYWRTSYDWRRFEQRINALPQFLAEIDGQRVHFMYIKSDHKDPIPLLMMHGWPGAASAFSSWSGR